MNLLDCIDHWGAACPEKIAHVSGDRTMTYGELRLHSDTFASYLRAKAMDRRSPIAVIGHREPEMLIAFLGAVKAGHPYVPLDTALPPQRIEKILATANPALALAPAEVARICEQPAPAPDKALRVGKEDPFYIIFTSGSSGEPKGVVITLECLTAFLEWMLGEQRFSERREIFLNQAPFSFDLSVMDLYCSLATGGALFSITRDVIAQPKLLYLALARSEVTSWVSTPSFAQMCLSERGFDSSMLPRVRRFLFCGETLAPGTAAQLLERFPDAEVWNTYGPTEATVAMTSVRIDPQILQAFSPLPVGRPMPGVEVSVTGPEGTAAPDGERGEIVIAGPNVSPGYLARPDLTGEVFFTRNGLRGYRTGDWGRFRDGMLFFEGRMDGQIKLNGYRIELGDLEANLRALPMVSDAAVLPKLKLGIPHSLTAFVILSEPGASSDFETSRMLRERLAERLPAYMLPRKFHFLTGFPMTPNGKIDRSKLAELLA